MDEVIILILELEQKFSLQIYNGNRQRIDEDLHQLTEHRMRSWNPTGRDLEN